MAMPDSGMDYGAPKLIVLHYCKKQHFAPVSTYSQSYIGNAVSTTEHHSYF
jgi:hypothetical protein